MSMLTVAADDPGTQGLFRPRPPSGSLDASVVAGPIITMGDECSAGETTLTIKSDR